eukprot:Protomagalhaensia_wolfi_Nauph_80__1100@NODE_1643_length_1424_cov_302_825993_g1272_i0_p2_GENE_NODE_1643_length_1424_cov_302_825993_g1272_i0NODE_1643_length_1424_cov_302_825993_g1272_i0_p2_ORF_typecomplete_len130_score22_46_NODE_1643_length_1424_cov_302_825993_g1272_i09031292
MFRCCQTPQRQVVPDHELTSMSSMGEESVDPSDVPLGEIDGEPSHFVAEPPMSPVVITPNQRPISSQYYHHPLSDGLVACPDSYLRVSPKKKKRDTRAAAAAEEEEEGLPDKAVTTEQDQESLSIDSDA